MIRVKRLPWSTLGLFVLVAFGTFLRFYHLDGKVYWHDEAHTALRVSGYSGQEFVDAVFHGSIVTAEEVRHHFQHLDPAKGVADTLNALSGRPEHGPLYYLLSRFWAEWFDDLMVATRSLSALISLLLFPALYWLCRELFGTLPVGRVAVALAAVSPFHLLYAQEARQYALWAVITVASSAALPHALRRDTKGAWAGYTVTLVLGLYTHLLFAAVMAAHGIHVATRSRPECSHYGRQLIRYGLALAVSGLAFTPWIAVLAMHFSDVQSATQWMSWEVPTRELTTAWALHVHRLFVDFTGAEYALPLTLVLVGGSIHAVYRRAAPWAWRFLAVLIVLTLSVVILPDLMLGGMRSLHSRYLIPALLGIEICAAYWLASGLCAAAQPKRRFAQVAALLVFFAGGYSCLSIVQADTWHSKFVSYHNPEVARIINSAQRPVLISIHGDINPGEILSLSHLLEGTTRLLLLGSAQDPILPEEADKIFLLNPSEELQHALRSLYRLEPIYPAGRLWRVVREGEELVQVDEDALAEPEGDLPDLPDLLEPISLESSDTT